MVHAPMGRFQSELKIGITFIFRFHSRPIQIVVLFPAQARRQKKLRHPTRPAEDAVRTTKGLQERIQLFEWDDGET